MAIAGVAAAAVTLFAVPLGLVLKRSYYDEDLVRLQRDTIAATRGIDIGAGRSDAIELPRSVDRLGVYRLNGRRVAGVGPAGGDALVRSTLATGRPADHLEGGHLVVAVPLLVNERVAGAVRAERDDTEAARDTRAAWLLLAAIGGAVVALAVVAALVIGRRLARPLERLAGAARELGEGDFSARAPHADIPEVDAVAVALDATAKRLDDLISRERAFSADASHQLRTPLAALRIELEGMQLRGDRSAEIPAALAQVDRLQTTIDTLLSVARDRPDREAETELRRLLDELETRWRGPLAAAGRPLRSLVRPTRPVAGAAPRVVTEILDVLVENALRHGEGLVTVSVREVDGWLAIDVADEGKGFEGDPELAFARRTGSTDGHGIGLSLARALAHAEGGSLSVTTPGPHPVLTLVLAQHRP